MLGGVFAAPMMPSASFGAATKSAYPASALHAAIYHSQSRVSFSVCTLAQHLGLQLGQAEQLMSDMSKRGILGPLQGRTQAGRWARSKVWIRPSNSVVATRTAASAEKVSKPTVRDVVKHIETRDLTPPDLRTELSNVDNVCCTDCGGDQS
mgnify:CR=1 FL=1